MKYDENNDVRIYEFSNGNNSESKHLIGSEIVNETPMYFYYCRDEDGALVRRNLERNERVTKIFDVLNEGEEPYLRIMNEVEITTDNSGVESNETEEILSIMYYLYVPKGTRVAEF